jgi:hypothetical protein
MLTEIPSTLGRNAPMHFLQNSSQWAKQSLRNKISSFESIAEAWERFQEYITACPHHGMQNWILIQTFYHGLKRSPLELIDAVAGGVFFSLAVGPAQRLVEKRAANQ